jgi:pimeloyl-ACP methyl ester carboxylesterase
VHSFTPSHRGGSGLPLLCLHGIVDTWRTWELVLPALERSHDVLAPTLPGHAGGPPLGSGGSEDALVDPIESALDDAGFTTAHMVGNSLGGYIALKLAARGRAESVVALAPAGGRAEDGPSDQEVVEHFLTMQEQAKKSVPHVDEIVSTVEGRRAVTRFTTSRFEHIPAELLAHQVVGLARCDLVGTLRALSAGWSVEPERIECPVRVVWGADDRILPWPSAAARYRDEWLPHADWIELEGVGHCPQLDVPTETAALVLELTAR